MLFGTHISHHHISATHYRLVSRSVCSSPPQSPSGRTDFPGTYLQISSSSSRTTVEPITRKRDTITACHLSSCQLQTSKLRQIRSSHRFMVGRVSAKKPHHGGQRALRVRSPTRLSYTIWRGPLLSKESSTVWLWTSNQEIVISKHIIRRRRVVTVPIVICAEDLCVCHHFSSFFTLG